MLINQFVLPTFCLCFPITGTDFRGMLHHVCDVNRFGPKAKTGLDLSELVNVGTQIDQLTIC